MRKDSFSGEDSDSLVSDVSVKCRKIRDEMKDLRHEL